ncbi:MAG: FAA hydrolase family protein [Neisseriaceae bacterium]|nr:MAG: FAA hydrolase family protein [Neisseriaceae bacterium]
MKIATFIYQQQRCVGQVDPEAQKIGIFDISQSQAKNGAQYIIELLANGETLPEIRQSVALADVILEAPIIRPRRNIFCVGKNYLDHVKEVAKSGLGSGTTSSAAAPEYPIFFSKVPESVIGHQASILSHEGLTEQLDYEAELALIIGKQGRGISQEEALDYVWGYTIINDVSARDLQKRHQQWHLAKSLDSFCPMGPWLVSKDEINHQDTLVKCWVNGELRQNSSTSQFIFDISTIIATLSAGITLYPGDIIATGTPSGVGMGFSPPKFLKSGDVVTIEIDGIGKLENTVR